MEEEKEKAKAQEAPPSPCPTTFSDFLSSEPSVDFEATWSRSRPNYAKEYEEVQEEVREALTIECTPPDSTGAVT